MVQICVRLHVWNFSFIVNNYVKYCQLHQTSLPKLYRILAMNEESAQVHMFFLPSFDKIIILRNKHDLF